ncbi:MAG: iron ABC transporter permease, partial [Rubrobacter sp.]|nr:iron ABC transporter permease [Rubrobacter sp.]
MRPLKHTLRRATTGKATLRGGAFSLKLDLRSALVFVIISLVAFAGVVANVGHGEYPIPPLDVIRTIFGFETSDSSYSFIVSTLRLPRALVAVVVGAALAISGAILQGLTRNGLAAPDIVGVNAGASLAAVTLIVALPAVSTAYLPPAAFVGALVVALLLYALAWRGESSPVRLILIGIGLAAIAQALTTLMITFGDIYE